MDGFSTEIRTFLTDGARTAVLGYTATDGRALVAPVWFVVEGPDDDPVLLFNTGAATAKGRSLRRDPRVALCVDDTAPRFRFVQVQGIAEVSEDPTELLRSAVAIGTRYMGAERGEEFGRRNGVPGELLVGVRPTKIVANFDVTG